MFALTEFSILCYIPPILLCKQKYWSSVARMDCSSGKFVLKAEPSRGLEHMKKASTAVLNSADPRQIDAL